jgi:hypothetical protein
MASHSLQKENVVQTYVPSGHSILMLVLSVELMRRMMAAVPFVTSMMVVPLSMVSDNPSTPDSRLLTSVSKSDLRSSMAFWNVQRSAGQRLKYV